jgi:hypothetical protein
MRVALSLDDFSVANNRMDLLLKLKEHFPKFKVSLFTVPVDEKQDWGVYQNRKEALKLIKDNLDWMQLIPHGYKHRGSEFRNADYRYFKEVTLPAIEKAFKDDGLPYEKGFKAPHWRWSPGVVKALDEEGWWLATDPRQPNAPRTKTYYDFSHGIDEPFWTSIRDLQLHGHIYGTRNDLGVCMKNLLKLPRDTEFVYVTNYLTQ